MTFTPAKLLQIINQLPASRRYWIAYSGGCDSHALLYALATLCTRLPAVALRPIHIDHAIHPRSAEWAQHCVLVCAALDLQCEIRRVDGRSSPGESPEAAARQARYSALAEVVEEGDLLLTAHHADDQAETLLLQLLRGAGPHGLAAMPTVAPFAQGYIARPLLPFTRADLYGYAAAQSLQWSDDPSNQELAYDRNYLRHAVTPRLQQRWPSWAQVVTRAASHQAEAAKLCDNLAQLDLATVATPQPDQLLIDPLLALSPERQRNLLRYWLAQLNLPLPTTQQLYQLQKTVLLAARASTPLVRWPGVEIRRYRNNLYAMPPLQSHDNTQCFYWDTAHTPQFTHATGTLTRQQLIELGMDAQRLANGCVTITYRQGGEKIQLPGRQHHTDLKKYLQERAVPPWQRDRLPLIELEGVTVVVGLS